MKGYEGTVDTYVPASLMADEPDCRLIYRWTPAERASFSAPGWPDYIEILAVKVRGVVHDPAELSPNTEAALIWNDACWNAHLLRMESLEARRDDAMEARAERRRERRATQP